MVARFDAALAQAKRELYGRRYSIQGHTIVLSPRNTDVAAAMQVDRSSTLIPGMRRWYAAMQRRCGARTPPVAWAFQFDVPTNAPDFAPYFVFRTQQAWYVF